MKSVSKFAQRWKMLDFRLGSLTMFESSFYHCLYSPDPSSDIKSGRRGELCLLWAAGGAGGWVRPSPDRPSEWGEARTAANITHLDTVETTLSQCPVRPWSGHMARVSWLCGLAEADLRPWDFPQDWGVMTLCRVTRTLVTRLSRHDLSVWCQWWGDSPDKWPWSYVVSYESSQWVLPLAKQLLIWMSWPRSEILRYDCCELWPLSDFFCSDTDGQIRLWGVHEMSQSQHWQSSDSEIMMPRLESLIQTFRVYIKWPVFWHRVLEKFHRSAEIVYQNLIATFYVAS